MTTRDSVSGAPLLSGAALQDRYWESVHEKTLGLIRRHGNSVALGPIELLRFGEPKLGARSVEWPIQGGLLAAKPGGRWVIRADGGMVEAMVEDYAPLLPRPVYAMTHLRVHLLFTRLFLLDLRGDATPNALPAPSRDRVRAASVDIALCLTVAKLAGVGRRPRAVLGILAGYHIACWSISGRTLGGMMMGQRVVATDGRRLTAAQAMLRFVTMPLSWLTGRPVHDDIAKSTVVIDEKEEGAATAAP